MKSTKALSYFYLIAAIVILIATYVVAEVIFRISRYNQIISSFDPAAATFTTTDGPLYTLDLDAGYSYVPNAQVTLRFYDIDNEVVRENKVSVNSQGHISPRDDLMEMSDAEFRIACLGDSFTATTTTERPWPSQVEDLLNQDEEIKRLTGKTSFKVVNLGLDGTGIDQWPAVFEHKAKPLKPDLVIINIFWNDIYRRFLYRDTIKIPSKTADFFILVTSSSLPTSLENKDCRFASQIIVDSKTATDKVKLAAINREIHTQRVRALPWKSLYPELLNRVLTGKNRFKMSEGNTPMFTDDQQAVSNSLVKLREIVAQHPRVLILAHPSVEECKERKAYDCVHQLINAGPDLNIQDMVQFLPLEGASSVEIDRWFNLPHDAHPSSYGCEVYSKAVLERIRKMLKQN